MNGDGSRLGPFDVAVIGYGPTGLALAHWLGSAGHNTVVIERWPDLYALPRAGHVDGEVMRLFQRMGVAETIAADSSVTRHTVIRDAEGTEMATVPAELCDQGWHSHYSLYQPNLERIMDAKVRETGHVTVLQGWLAESIDQKDDGEVVIRIASGETHDGQWIKTDRRQLVSARWLIGADGANSVVQKHIEGGFRDFGYKARDLVIFADRLEPAAGAAMPDSEVGMVLPRPYCAWRESGKRYARWEFSVHDEESSSEMSTESKAWQLIAPWGFNPRNARLIRHSVFEFETVLAEHWRRGNLLLAGDAAHRMPPFQGQGMCSGQRDAAALAWRLDLVIRGVADAALLDSYAPERKPQVAELITQAAERGSIFWSTDQEVARERDTRMRKGFASQNLTNGYGTVPPIIDGFLMKGPTGVIAPAGQLSAQFPVNRSGDTALLDDHLGAGWQLLSVDSTLLSALRPEDHKVLKLIGTAEVLLARDPNSAFADVRGSYVQWLSGLGCKLLLIRPDCYIFGGAADADGVRDLFDSLVDQLHLRAEFG